MTLLAAYLGSFVPALGWTLAHFLWQGALVALVLEVLLKTCRTAQARHNLALGALIMMAALPIVTFYWLKGDVRVVFVPAGFPGLTESRALTWEKVAVGAWLIGVTALAVRMAGGLWLVERLRRGSTPLPPVWASRCALLQQRMAGSLKVVFAQSMVAAPLVAGWLKPMVLIPTAALTRMPVDQLEALILHELAHVRRFDAFANLIQAVVETVLFYHPAVWWVSRCIRVEREHCCDDLAVAAVQDPALYVRALQSLETLRPAPVGALASNGADLKVRAARILGLASAPERPALSRMAAVLILTLAAAAVTHSAAVKAESAPSARLAKAMAAISPPARALGVDAAAPTPDQAEAAKPVVLEALLSPKIAVAATDAAPVALTQSIALPPVDQAAAPVARPIEVAVAPPPPAVQAQKPADPLERAASFVQSYAATTAKRQAIARWVQPICVDVEGLADHADDPQPPGTVIRQRVEAVAKEIGVEATCWSYAGEVEILFTDNPQATLDSIIKRKSRLLGDASSGTRSTRTVTLPIQAWYETNGKGAAANETGELKAQVDYWGGGWAGLKTPVLYQAPFQPGGPTPPSNMGIGQGSYSGGFGAVGGAWGSRSGFIAIPSSPSRALWAKRQFLNAFVIVDLKRTTLADVHVLADYLAMVALSQPRSLGACQALPSITDLFASCPGRAAPTGLTSADMAYLHALYAGDEQSRADHAALSGDVVNGMAAGLSGAEAVAR